MSIGGTKNTGNEHTDSALDANASSTTTPLKTNGGRYISLFVLDDTGTHATHVITIQISGDGVNWEDTANTVTGTGSKVNVLCIAGFVRAKVTTLEGGASTVDVTLVVR